MSQDRFCVYLVKYKGDKHPPNYIGSTSISKILHKSYMGSASSKKYGAIVQEEQKNNTYLYSTHILETCSSRKEALEIELKMQKEFSVVTSKLFWNMAYAQPNGFFGMDNRGVIHPSFGKPGNRLGIKNPEQSKRMKLNNPMKNGMDEASKKKISRSKMGHAVSKETRKILSEFNKYKRNPMQGKTHSELTRKKLSLNHSGGMKRGHKFPIKKCPHCSRLVSTGGSGKRHHFSNCKLNDSFWEEW